MGWWDSIFGPSTPQPAHPPSRHPLSEAYPMLPPSRRIDNRRHEPRDYAYWMRRSAGNPEYDPQGYNPSMSVSHSPVSDPYATASPLDAHLETGTADTPDAVTSAYSPSFAQDQIIPRSNVAPYRKFEFGPNLPPQQTASGLPSIPPHLPWAPGDPGWTPPPSPSGPHNRGGDPVRPGVSDMTAQDVAGLTLNSNPWGY